MAATGIDVSYDTVRNWCVKFGNQYSSQIRKKRGQLGDMWCLDVVLGCGAWMKSLKRYMVSCIILDILVQKRKNEKAAMKFFKKLLKVLQATPLKIVTDKLRRYSAARGEVAE